MGFAAFLCHSFHIASGVQFVIDASIENQSQKISDPAVENKPSVPRRPLLPAVINTWSFTNATRKGENLKFNLQNLKQI